jgi:hypothetical protein
MKAKIGQTLMRIEYKNLFPGFVSYEIERSRKIGITTDKHERIGGVAVGIFEKLGHNVDVRPFLFHLHDMDISIRGRIAIPALLTDGRYPDFVLVVIAFDYFETAMRNKRLKINILPLYGGGIMRIGFCPGRKVFYVHEFMVGVKEIARKRNQIKPLILGVATKQPVVKITAVNIGNRSHDISLKLLRSRTFRFETPLRVGRTLRLDMNPLESSPQIISNFTLINKKAKSAA